MTQRKNGLPHGFAPNPLHCQQRGQHHPHQSGVMQPKMAMPSQLKKPPVPPPVYRPQPVPKVLQTKKAVTHQPVNQSRPAPVAPPVYRPQPVPHVLQRKMAAGQPSQSVQPKRQPVAPPVYRPQPQKIVQPKLAAAAHAHTPNRPAPVYSPQPVPKVLPAGRQPVLAKMKTPAASGQAASSARNSIVSRPSSALPTRGTIQRMHPHPQDVGRHFLIRHPRADSDPSVGTYRGPNQDGTYQFEKNGWGVISLTHERIIGYRPTVGLMHPPGMIRPVEERVEGRSEVFLSEADLSGAMARQRRDPSLLERMVVTTYEQQPDYPEYEQNARDLQSLGVPILNSFDISNQNSSQRLSLLEPDSNIHFQMPRVPRSVSGYSTQKLVSDTLNIPHRLGRDDITISITTPHPSMYKDISIHNRNYGLESGKTFGKNDLTECHSDSDDDLEGYGYTHKQSTKDQSAEVSKRRKKYKFRPQPYYCREKTSMLDKMRRDREDDDDDNSFGGGGGGGGGLTGKLIVGQ